MPRPARPWFRFYVEACSDRKLRRLKPAQRWLWVSVLAAARQSPEPGVLFDGEIGEPMTDAGIADFAGMTPSDVTRTLPLFERAEMIDRHESGAWHVTNFGRRQYESDVSTNRTRKHRSKERSGNVPTSVPGTFQERPSERPSERDSSLAPATESETEIDLQGGENSRTAPDDRAPPPRRCPAHSHIDGPGPPCIDCRDARVTHNVWQRQHATPPAKSPELTEQERTQRAQLARAEAGTARVRELAQEPADPNATQHVRQLRDSLRPHQENP